MMADKDDLAGAVQVEVTIGLLLIAVIEVHLKGHVSLRLLSG
jgi:hypothetical protein